MEHEVQLVLHGVRVLSLALALAPVLQADDERTVGRTLSRDEAVTGNLGVVLDFGNLLEDALNLLHRLVRGGQAAARCHAHVHHHGALVFLRHKARLGGLHEVNQQDAGHDHRAPCQPAVVDERHHAFLIFGQQGGIRRIISVAHDGVDVVLAFVAAGRPHPHGTQGRAERQGVQAGDTHGHGHRDPELRVEDTGGAAHEGHGDEHGHEHERTGDYGHRHVREGILRGQVGRLVAGIELRLHGLDHDDGVIHHRTDDQHEGEQRQDVDAEPGYLHGCERTHEGHDDGDGRDDRTLEVLQEEVHHENHQDDGDDQGLDHLMDGGEQEVVGTHHGHEFRAFRQVFGQVGQQF